MRFSKFDSVQVRNSQFYFRWRSRLQHWNNSKFNFSRRSQEEQWMSYESYVKWRHYHHFALFLRLVLETRVSSEVLLESWKVSGETFLPRIKKTCRRSCHPRGGEGVRGTLVKKRKGNIKRKKTRRGTHYTNIQIVFSFS